MTCGRKALTDNVIVLGIVNVFVKLLRGGQRFSHVKISVFMCHKIIAHSVCGNICAWK